MSADQHGNRSTVPVTPTRTSGRPDWPTLMPAAILACGAAERPVDRLMGLQSAVGRAVQLAVDLGCLWSFLPAMRMSDASRRVVGPLPVRASAPAQRNL